MCSRKQIRWGQEKTWDDEFEVIAMVQQEMLFPFIRKVAVEMDIRV